jgi:hypothetical protein
MSGKGDGVINFTTVENISMKERTATVAISGAGVTTKNITVTQAGAGPTLTLSSENIVFKAIPSSPQIIKIKSNIQWNAEIEQSNDWLTITPAFNNGNDSLAISAKPNPGIERIASVIISGEGISDRVIQVTQSIPAEGENSPPLVDFNFEDMIDRYVLTNKSTDRDGDVLVSKWESSNSNIVFSGEVNPYFLLPYAVGNNNTADITLTVTDGIYTVSTTKALPIPETTWYRVYEMAKIVQTSVANDVKHDWYISQHKTGVHSSVNCGPTNVTMALKWVYPDFNKTVEDARNTYHPEGGWWYTNDIIDYLNLCGVSGRIIPFGINKSSDLMAELDNGNIAILCLDMYYIRNQTKGIQWPVDKFYYTDIDWGHFIVVKGYKIADRHILFEVYDPASSMTYSDGTYMGKDRLYRSEDIMKSTDVWWKYAIIIHPQSQLRKGERIPFNRDNIPNQKGR